MNTLLDVIKYDHKNYNEVTDPQAKAEIEKLAAKLKPLESEILRHANGDITIMKSGNVFTSMFPSELAGKIKEIVVRG
jgi:hypothetical protein